MISIRFLLAILGFFGYALQYAQKTNMSVAIVCMVNNTAVLQRRGLLDLSEDNGTNFTIYNGQKSDSTLIEAESCPKKDGSGTAGAVRI